MGLSRRTPVPTSLLAMSLVITLHGIAANLVLGPVLNSRPPASDRPVLKTVITLKAAPAVPQVDAARILHTQPPKAPSQPKPAAIQPPLLVDRQLASRAAPPAPTAQEWAFAATYTNKNSKGYRYHWGQQLRSLMGAALEGPDQGAVRFRVEIAPDGRLVQLETLWSTSRLAEQRARQALEQMPRLPPTPTGRPLIFERTISFTPFASDDPPSYQDDCLPDSPAFSNPFAWDGQSRTARTEPVQASKADPQAMEDCLKQLPQTSIEAEVARDRRLMERWGGAQPAAKVDPNTWDLATHLSIGGTPPCRRCQL